MNHVEQAEADKQERTEGDIDWDKEIELHKKEIEEKETKKEEKRIKSNPMIQTYNMSWELLKECVIYHEENENSWKEGKEQRKKERETD